MRPIDADELKNLMCSGCNAGDGSTECRNKCVDNQYIDAMPTIKPSAIMKWIKTKDRLPEVDTFVLVYYPRWENKYTSGIEVAYFDGYVWDICGEFNPGKYEITHWQPLPDKPID